MLGRRAIIGLSLSCLSAAVSAAPAQPAGQAKGRADPNEVVCQKVEVTGSRLAVKRICLSRAEWEDRRLQDKAALEKAQVLGSLPQK